MARHGENIYLRKDGRYEGRYVIGKKDNGRTAFGYVYGKKYTEVKRKLERIKGEQATDDTISTLIHRDGTIASWMQTWLECYIRDSIKQSTYSIYRGQMEKHIIPIVGRRKLRTVDKSVMQYLYETMLENKVSESTAQSVCRRFRAALYVAQEEGLLRAVPALPFRKKTVAKKKEGRYLTESEQQRLEEVLDTSSSKDLAVLFSLYTGTRIGECCALQWEDIDFDEHEVQITHTIQRVRTYGTDKKTALLRTEAKTQNAIRRIPLTKTLENLLFSLKQEKHALKKDFIFGSGIKFAEPKILQNHMNRLSKQADLKDVHFHTLRHTFATRCIENNMDVKTLSELLGHSSVKITLDWYCHSTKQQKKEMIQRLEKHAA